MQEYTTRFGSMGQYEKGRVEVLNDEAGHYAIQSRPLRQNGSG